MLRAFFRDSIIYFIPTVISRGLAILLIPLYTRVLAPADYGSLDLLMAFSSLVTLSVALEVAQAVARFYGDELDPRQRVLFASSAFWFSLVAYSACLCFALLFSRELSPIVMARDDSLVEFRVGVAYIFFFGMFSLIQNQFRWELKSIQFSIVSLVVSIVTAGVAIALTYGLGLGLLGMLLGMTIGAAIGCAYGLWQLRHTFRPEFQFSALTEMLRFSAPLVPSSLAVFIGLYIDRIMISTYLSVEDVGIYGMGFRVASIAGLMVVGFQGALTPLIYAHHLRPSTPGNLATIFRLFAACALLLWLSASLFAPEILGLMTVPAYYGAASVVSCLVAATLLSSMYIFAPGTAIAKKTHVILGINLAGAALNVGLNFVLIPQLGIQGAAASKLLSCAVVFGAYMWFGQLYYRIPHAWRPIAGATMTIALIPSAVGIVSDGEDLDWPLKALCLAFAIALVFFTHLLRSSDLRDIKRFFSPVRDSQEF